MGSASPSLLCCTAKYLCQFGRQMPLLLCVDKRHLTAASHLVRFSPQPVALISILERHYVVAKTGPSAGNKLARELSICQWTLVPLKHTVLAISDLQLDARSAHCCCFRITLRVCRPVRGCSGSPAAQFLQPQLAAFSSCLHSCCNSGHGSIVVMLFDTTSTKDTQPTTQLRRCRTWLQDERQPLCQWGTGQLAVLCRRTPRQLGWPPIRHPVSILHSHLQSLPAQLLILAGLDQTGSASDLQGCLSVEASTRFGASPSEVGLCTTQVHLRLPTPGI